MSDLGEVEMEMVALDSISYGRVVWCLLLGE
jgi:hypothetical protein